MSLNTIRFLWAAAQLMRMAVSYTHLDVYKRQVYIPSHTTLFIAADSEIKASRNVDLLLAKKKEQIDDRKGESSEGAFVRVKNAENVTITGGGRINGSGEWYVYEPRELPALVPFDISRLPRRDQDVYKRQDQGRHFVPCSRKTFVEL